MKTAAYASKRSSESSDWLSHGSQLQGRSFGPQAEKAKAGTGGIDLLKGPLFVAGMPVRAKLTIGEPNDKYEQEADRVAEQVMSMPDGAVQGRVQREGVPEEEEELQMKPVIQREELPEEEELQMKPLIQREELPEEEEELQMKPVIQREELPEEQEELQMKPLIQREELPEEEEELQMKPVIQREELPEEEELQMKPVIQREELPEEEELQMKADSSGQGSVATGALEERLSSSKGWGSPLSADVRSFMEPRFGADFSGVRVHTGSEAVQMNREVGAQAFAHGRDVYFGAGKGPGKDALTAHELTHVVQQTGRVQRKNQTTPVQISGGMGDDRINRKEVTRRLDFVTMKRNAPTYTKILLKELHLRDDGGDYGHWWVELANGKSFGWWPSKGVGLKETLKIDRVEGLLNQGIPNLDPHHGEKAEEKFNPAIKLDENALYLDVYSQITTQIENFSRSFSGSWNWRLAWGKNCHTFQERMMEQLGMTKKNSAPFLSKERKTDDATKEKYKEIEQLKPKTEEDLEQTANTSVHKNLKGVFGKDYQKEYESSTATVTKAAQASAKELTTHQKTLGSLIEQRNQLESNQARTPEQDQQLEDIKAEIQIEQQQVTRRKERMEDQGFKLDPETGTVDPNQFLHHHVEYLTTQPERDKFKLDISGGTLTQQGKPFDTASSFTAFSGRGWAIYVMDPSGVFYAGPHKIGQFHHSSFLAGGAVAGAGELKTNKSGSLEALSNKSGHYTPSTEQMLQVFAQLEKSGVSLDIPLQFHWSMGIENDNAAKFYKKEIHSKRANEIDKSLPRAQADLDEITEIPYKYRNLLKVDDDYIKKDQEEYRDSKAFTTKTATKITTEYVETTKSLQQLTERLQQLEEESRHFEDLGEERIKQLDEAINKLNQEIKDKTWLKQYLEQKVQDQGISIKNLDTGEIDADQFKDVHTEYLITEPEREKFKLDISGTFSQQGKPLDTTGMFTAFWGRGAAIYVMDPNGVFYAGPHQVGRFHHSSFLAGGAVAGAGELQTDASGNLKKISNKTGHYKAGKEEMFQVVSELDEKGVSLNGIPMVLVTANDAQGSDYPGGAGKFYTDEKQAKQQAQQQPIVNNPAPNANNPYYFGPSLEGENAVTSGGDSPYSRSPDEQPNNTQDGNVVNSGIMSADQPDNQPPEDAPYDSSPNLNGGNAVNSGTTGSTTDMSQQPAQVTSNPYGQKIPVPSPSTVDPMSDIAQGANSPFQPANLLPAPAPISFDANLSANPVLYFQGNNAGGTNLRVAAADPGGGWARVEQFCAYLATYWLTHGYGSGGLQFMTLDLTARQTAASTLASWGSSGGVVAQEQHACQQLGGQSIAKSIVQQNATQGSDAQGKRIWFGNNQHAQAAVVLDNGNYRVYNPNTGNTQEMTGSQFSQYIQTAHAFVVA